MVFAAVSKSNLMLTINTDPARILFKPPRERRVTVVALVEGAAAAGESENGNK
jgi:hypothetical protein